MAPRIALCFLSLVLVSSFLSASAQPIPNATQPIPTATPYFLTQGGGDPDHGGQVKVAPPAPLATPRKMGPPLAGPVGVVFGQVVTALQANGNFTVLLDLVANYIDTQELIRNLSAPATLFAPTDQAFSVIPPTVAEGLKENPAVLFDIIQYHFIKGFFPAAVLLSAPAGSGESFFHDQTINVTASDGAVFIGVGQPLAKVTHPDVALIPGAFVVHGISKVLTPPRFVFYAVPNVAAQTGSILANGTIPGVVVRPQNVTVPPKSLP